MMHINRQKVQAVISDEWVQKAQKALEEVRSMTPEQRAQAINDRSAIWTDLKNALHGVSNGKCWYCESIEARHDDEIDHFRPKNAVFECSEHTGYWWLAFDWKNFRYSCVFCNQWRIHAKNGNKDAGGKRTHFPLLPGTKRVFDITPPFAHLNEKPVLLDPMVRSDTRMLDFEIDGTAQPRKSKEEASIEYLRASESIRIYHLNAYDLTERRKQLVCNQIKWLVDLGELYYYKHLQPGGEAWSEAYASVVDQLSIMIEDEYPYSMAARSIIIKYRKKSPWLNDVLEEAS
ncbi:MAG TPA: hypothetical protein VF458_16150 [Ktedonobacteraceae bacterium]